MPATCSRFPRRWGTAAALSVLGLLLACSNPREANLGEQPCPSFDENVAPVLDRDCASCHGPSGAEAGYSVTSYWLTVRPREDGTARLTPGDADSLFVRALSGKLEGHPQASEASQKLLTDWSVRCMAPRANTIFHSPTWSDPWAEDFHGKVLRQSAYDTESCQECHGKDLSGGPSKVACATCHQKPLDSCDTCHGNAGNAAPPRDLGKLTATTRVGVGAHQAHVNDGPLHKGYDCIVCHPAVKNASDEGHYQKDGKPDLSPADVTLASGKGGTAVWSHDEATCTNGACHAPSSDANATLQVPVWTKVGQDQAACGTCHGLPPSTHTQGVTQCEMCHRPAYEPNGQLRPDVHANGKVELAYDPQSTSTCSTCHGQGDQPAPPVDTHGNTDESLLTVGAHRAHLEARHKLAANVECTECHLVPTKVEDPGHMDSASPAEVFPQGAQKTLANKDGAVSMYDASTGTCTTYCHGAGQKLSGDTAAAKQSPKWNGGTNEAGCGSCHGLPPQGNGHPQATGLTSCVNCHAATIDASGALISTTDAQGKVTSKHLNGTVEFQGP